MITSKQRSYLRSLANGLDVIFQVGKAGIEEQFLKQIDQAIEVRELLKIKLLDNSGLTAREASDIICKALKCEGIQAIGSKIVIYKRSSKNPRISIE